ncbi:LysR family transcriptional regulator [Actinoallomurus sp. CA-150999]|uniref:LysR family transcriptional regulator n=1 Tax=Actinoallomurus sp. CA-150999 TaxID=3239887 RepID=UPI003D8A80CA
MDIRSLRYAITLAEELHFGRAAQRHYISAQPFGRRIQDLERDPTVSRSSGVCFVPLDMSPTHMAVAPPGRR